MKHLMIYWSFPILIVFHHVRVVWPYAQVEISRLIFLPVHALSSNFGNLNIVNLFRRVVGYSYDHPKNHDLVDTLYDDVMTRKRFSHYRKASNIRRTKSQNSNASRLIL